MNVTRRRDTLYSGCTPLHWAACHRNRHLIELLIGAGAAVDAFDDR